MKNFVGKKEDLLNKLLKWVISLGAIAYIPSLLACISDKLYLLAVVNTLAYISLVAVFFSPRTSFRTRLFTTVFVTLLLGAAVFFQTGTDGAGYIWLICSVFIAALFGQIPFTVITIIATQLIIALFVLFQAVGIINHNTSLESIIAIASNLLLVSITLSLITYSLLTSLREEIDGQEKTLRLLDHRVRNNLQTIESLVRLEGGEKGTSSTLSRRIRAISEANKLILSNPAEGYVELDELLRLISDPIIFKIETRRAIRIVPEKLTEVVVGFSDLFEIIHESPPITVTIDDEVRIQGGCHFCNERTLQSRIDKSLVPRHWFDPAEKNVSCEEIILINI